MQGTSKRPLVKPTRELIERKLNESDAAVEEAILRIYERQTADEKSSKDTRHDNQRGFSCRDVKLGSKYAQWIKGMREKGAQPGTCLRRQDHRDAARAISLRYTRQLLEEAEAKYAAAIAARPPITDDPDLDEERRMQWLEQQAEREESRQVAEFKMRRDEQLQLMGLFKPGALVNCNGSRYGFDTFEDLVSGDYNRSKTFSRKSPLDFLGRGIVVETRANGANAPGVRVMFSKATLWVQANWLEGGST